MLNKILNVLEEEYASSKSSFIEEQLLKFKAKISKTNSNPSTIYRVVHIINDSPYNHELITRIDSFLREKESLCCKHDFFILGQNHTYLSNTNEYLHRVHCIPNLTDSNFISHIFSADMILIQYLSLLLINFFNKITLLDKTLLAWMPWGGDYIGYNQKVLFNEFDIYYCNSKSFHLNNEIKRWNNEYKREFDFFLHKVSIIFSNLDIFRELSIGRPHLLHVNYVFPQPYDINDELYKNKHIGSKFFLNYLSLLDNKKDHIKIVLGNSSTPENNHFSALLDLKRIQSISKKPFFITGSLSYGNLKSYKNIVDEYGKELFGDNFFSFSEFLNPLEFSIFVKSQDLAYMNHIRPQGFGAINLYLVNNIPVFIREDNPTIRVINDFQDETGCQFSNVYKINDLASQINTFPRNKESNNTEWTINKTIVVYIFEQSKKIFKAIFS